jgi:hypothetical protein
MAACVGCLGSLRCWICLGAGSLPGPAVGRTCHRCGGSGECTYCTADATPVVAAASGLNDDEACRAQLERLILQRMLTEGRTAG